MSITTRNPVPVLLRTVLIAVFAVTLVLVAFAAWFVRAPIPKLDGKVEAPGLDAVAYIRRDERGVPHIEAQTIDDALYAQGFACAQDRLWQMDTLRRQAEGRLSEVAGPAALEIDRYMRTLGLGAVARADAAALDAKTRAGLEAYAAGVNAEATTHPLPIEFKLLGYSWDPWTPEDTIAIAKLMAQRLDDQWYYLDVRAQLSRAVGAEAAGALTDMQVPSFARHIPGYETPSAASTPWYSNARLLADRQLGELLAALPDLPHHTSGTGSNNWMVAGTRTSTHRPVLSNDTHLDTSLPSTWWIADVHGGALNAAGFTLPGLPGIILGHNQRIAFGITSSEQAVQDIYVERFRTATSDQYLANGKWIAARHRIERIGIKRHPDETLDVLVTRHGPVISRSGTRGLALAWTILGKRDDGRALLLWDLAQNYAQFRAAVSHLVGPSLNFGFADVAGHIGYQDSGTIPLRAHGDGSVPVEGQDDTFAWRGYVPFNRLPHALDPPAGYLVTANQELVAPSFRPTLSTYFEAPFRAYRIASRLARARGATPADIGSIQADTIDYPRSQLARATARVLSTSADPALQLIATQLAAWNGMMNADSRAATFVMAEEQNILAHLLEPRTGHALYRKYHAHYVPTVPLVRALAGDKRLRSIGITRDTILAEIPRSAREAAVMLHADGPRGLDGVPQWGERNAALYQHPLSAKWVLGFLSVAPVAQPGSALAVYAGRPHHGPSQRLLIDLSDFDDNMMLLTLGESGIYSDPHYDDQVDDFVHVRMVSVPFSKAAVLAATRHTLVLEPPR